MMQLPDTKFYPSLLIRISALPYSEFHENKVAEVLLKEQFQQAILLASKDLYDQLHRHGFIYDKLGKALKVAVYKYYNRMSYRPTPFGAFASVSLTTWKKENKAVIREAGQQLLTFPDFRSLSNATCERSNDATFYLNPSLYKSGDGYRYYARHSVPGSERDTFRIMNLGKARSLKKLIEYLKIPVTYQAMLCFLRDEMGQSNAPETISGLVQNQILFHSAMPTITRLEFPRLTAEQFTGTTYSIAYHQQHGGIYAGYQRDLQTGLYALSRLATRWVPATLTSFAQKFAERFEQNEIPLLLALDPQTGISYLGSEKSPEQNEVADRLVAKADDVGLPGVRSASGRLIIEKLIDHDRKDKNGILLNHLELSALKDQAEPPLPLPPSFAVTFRTTGNKVFIEHAGGSSATAIAGRFSHDSGVLRELKNIAEAEQQRNPTVIFAEIAAIDHSFTDNINTRGHFRNYEIPVLTHSELSSEHVIQLNDLTVQVIEGKVVLRSRSLNKEIIPRLGSAYNYSLSNLPVFRFLGDLQYQGIQCNLSFDPELIVPALSHYPRISFENCILSPAKWVWNKSLIDSFTTQPAGLDHFIAHSKQEGLTRRFVLAEQDRELVFDLACDDSIRFLLLIIRGKNRVVLKEFFLPENGQEVKDAQGRFYVSQLIAFLINQEPVYKGLQSSALAGTIIRKRESYIPGSEWSYYKIYAHHETQNLFLRDPKLVKLISTFCKIKAIRKWFFVRYADPRPHLRIRFYVKESFNAAFSTEFRSVMKPYIDKTLVSDFVIGTYEPELVRYGHAGMGRVEAVFQRSSDLILLFHGLENAAQAEAEFAISSVQTIVNILIPEIAERFAFLRVMASQVLKNAPRRVSLDQYYRLNQQRIELAAVDPFTRQHPELTAKMNKLSATLKKHHEVWQSLGNAQKQTLIADLIHMHINRLNASATPELESGTYYLLFKLYRSFLARTSKGTPSDQHLTSLFTEGI